MSMPDSIHKEILTKEQVKLLPVVADFSKNFGLVGGPAIALIIGHRESLDFDLFSMKKLSSMQIGNTIKKHTKIDTVVVNKLGEFTIIIDGVKMTFFHYPFEIPLHEKTFFYSIKGPDLLTLAAMKAYALGMREKWKDYVDLYFFMRDFYSIQEVIKKAQEIFKGEFNDRMFINQLAYFEDISYQEPVIYKKGFEVSQEVIKKELIKFSLLKK